jgi:hypothetical protein
MRNARLDVWTGQTHFNSVPFSLSGSVISPFKAVSRFACHRTPKNLRPGGSVWSAAASGIPRDAAFNPLRHEFSPLETAMRARMSKKGRNEMRLPWTFGR